MNKGSNRTRILVAILAGVLVSPQLAAVSILQRTQYGAYVWYLHTYSGSGGSALANHITFEPESRNTWLPTVKSCAASSRIDWQLVDLVIRAESAYVTDAVSVKGATGLMQLMPDTAAELVVDAHDPAENICGGTQYLAMLYQHYQDWSLALAAYNAGAGNVDKYQGIPPFPETQQYVSKILTQYQDCLLYTSPSPRDQRGSRMPSSA